MKNKILAKRYSTAFFKIFSEEQFGLLLKDIKKLYKMISQETKLITILHSPITSDNRKEEILKDITKSLNFRDKWYSFIILLIKRDRITVFSLILEELEKTVYQAVGKIKVKIMLAKKENENIIGKIETKVAEIVGKKVVSELVMEPTIIGGFIAQTESLRIDGSIKGNLVRLQKIIQDK